MKKIFNLIGWVAIIILCFGATVNNKENTSVYLDKLDVLEQKIDRLETKIDRLENKLEAVDRNVNSTGKDLYDKMRDIEYYLK